MAKSIALAADPSRLASLLLSYIPAVCAFVAPRHPGASAAIIDRLSHSRARSGAPRAALLSGTPVIIADAPAGAVKICCAATQGLARHSAGSHVIDTFESSSDEIMDGSLPSSDAFAHELATQTRTDEVSKKLRGGVWERSNSARALYSAA